MSAAVEPLTILERREGMVNAVALITSATDHTTCSQVPGLRQCTSGADAYAAHFLTLSDRERFAVVTALLELSLEAVMMGAEHSGMASDSEMLERLALTSAQRLEAARAGVTP